MMRHPSDYDRKFAGAKTSPSPKDTTCLLCEYLGEEDKGATKKDETQVPEKHLVHECPKGLQCYNAGDGSKTYMPK